jgi:hypothetical protein
MDKAARLLALVIVFMMALAQVSPFMPFRERHYAEVFILLAEHVPHTNGERSISLLLGHDAD